MKSFLSLTLATCLLAQTSLTFARPVSAYSALERAESLQVMVNEFKHSIYSEGKNAESAIKHLSEKILDEKFSIADLQLFVQLNAQPQEVERFNRAIQIALEDVKDISELSSQELSFILQNAMTSTTQTGANFMSCTVGLGIGVPLIAVGVIVGIVALVNATASKEVVTKDYIEKKSQSTTSYLNTKADLELEITTYESDIIYYQDEISELRRRIDSGNFGTVEVENMQQSIRELEFYISDANALIKEVHVDLDYFNSKYDEDMVAMSKDEVSALSRVDERRANSGKQAVVAGIAAALGAAFTIGGVSDCN